MKYRLFALNENRKELNKTARVRLINLQPVRDATLGRAGWLSVHKIYSELILLFYLVKIYSRHRKMCVISEATSDVTAPKKTFPQPQQKSCCRADQIEATES